MRIPFARAIDACRDASGAGLVTEASEVIELGGFRPELKPAAMKRFARFVEKNFFQARGTAGLDSAAQQLGIAGKVKVSDLDRAFHWKWVGEDLDTPAPRAFNRRGHNQVLPIA